MNQESPKYINDDIQRSNLLKMADLVALSKQYTDRLEGEMTELKQRLESSKAVTKEIQITDNIVVSIKFLNGVTQIPLTQAFAVNWGAIRLIRNLIMTQEGSKIPDAVTPRLEATESVVTTPIAVVAPEVIDAPVAAPEVIDAPVAAPEVIAAPVAVVAPVAALEVLATPEVIAAPVAVVAPVEALEVLAAPEVIAAPVAVVAPVEAPEVIAAPVAVVAPVAAPEVIAAPVAVVAPVAAPEVIAAPVAVVAPVAAPVAVVIPTLATAELV
jgi:hypothetical protein